MSDERSLKELHKILREKYQFTNPEALRSKEAAREVIKNLEQKASIADDNLRKTKEEDKARHLSKVQRMRAKLEKQPKIRMMIPLTGKEKKGQSFESVIINGYRTGHKGEGTDWPKGVYINVPKQVADILEESLNQESEVGEKYALDRTPEVEKALAG